jgi:DNA-binding response OmpR family regulator
VEDDVPLRRLFTKVLAEEGYEILEAGTASEGFSLIHSRGPAIDLAILDMVLPDRSGLDLAAEIHREHLRIKILYISGYNDSLAMEVIRRHSPQVVLLKPFPPALLIERAARLLSSQGCSGLPWERLMEASDRLTKGVVLMTYKDTAVGFGVAAAHAAALREARVAYLFRPGATSDYSMELVVARENLRRARELAAGVGLGADIAVPAA